MHLVVCLRPVRLHARMMAIDTVTPASSSTPPPSPRALPRHPLAALPPAELEKKRLKYVAEIKTFAAPGPKFSKMAAKLAAKNVVRGALQPSPACGPAPPLPSLPAAVAGLWACAPLTLTTCACAHTARAAL